MRDICFPVVVISMVYNHSRFIKQALDGFVMQKTQFPFLCAIFDDASNDGTKEMIRLYLDKDFISLDRSVVYNKETNDYSLFFAKHKDNPNCYFAVFFLKYNHYSVNKSKNKISYLTQLYSNYKYIALCEGDDYWIHPHKLQIQVNYLDNNLNCSMTCNRTKLYSERRHTFVGEQYSQLSNMKLNPVDVINRTGLYISTCSIVYRKKIEENYPDYCNNCNVGDYPLQIMAAMKGYIYYFNELMSVYRIESEGSWVSRQKFNSVDPNRIHIVKSQVEMFEGFSKDYPSYYNVFENKIFEHVCKNFPRWNELKCNKNIYISIFEKEINILPLKWRVFYYICKLRLPHIKGLYMIVFLRDYLVPQIIYNKIIQYFKVI